MRLTPLRRSRLLASLLLLASPGAAGVLLPVLHPCPVDTPWLAHREHGQQHVAHHPHQVPAAGHQGGSCNCIGSCVAGAAAAPPSPSAVQAAVLPAGNSRWPLHDSSLELAPTATLLPPSTAPPVV